MRLHSEILSKVNSSALSICAGFAAFIFTLLAFLQLTQLDQQVVASLGIGLFALLVVWIASEKPNGAQARAMSTLIDRLLAVKTGDLTSPAPELLKTEMPSLAAAVDGLFEQVRSNLDHAQAAAMYDPVTSLPNRVHFRREAERVLKERSGSELLGLLFIDLDGFKEVNDSLGHAKGDQMLAMVAKRLRTVAKGESGTESLQRPIVARLAGDEFTLLLPCLASEGDAERVAGRVLEELLAPFDGGGQSIHMGASIGVALAPAHGTDLQTLMKAADVAMYHAKGSGRARVCVYTPELAAAFQERSDTEHALRQAIEKDELVLAFQPQVCARSGAVVGGEALLRWQRPDLDEMQSDRMLGLVTQHDLVAELGDWMIDAAARTLVRWKGQGLAQRLSFNVSPRQIERAGFFERLRGAMGRAGASPWQLELELSEAVAMRASDTALAELASLRRDGVSIALDDFGSGYSNLTRLRGMPLDRVKLDRNLVRETDSSESARTIVSAVIHLVHGLGCQAVAQGVDRREQIDVLRAVGCDLIQGSALAGPMSEAELSAWLAARGPRPSLSLIA